MNDETASAIGGTSSFEEKLKQKLAARLATQAEPKTPPAFDFKEDIPEVDFKGDPQQEALSLAIKQLDIVDAYTRWCGKTRVTTRKRESIKVSCPNPAHPDKDPSCWLNRDKNVYHCAKCGGGDVYDIAAYHFGYLVPQYKNDAEAFKALRAQIGESLGFSFVRGPTGVFAVTSVSTPPESAVSTNTPLPSTPPVTETSAESVEDSASNSVPPEPQLATHVPVEWPTIDWQSLIPEETFLYSWMTATTQDDCPEEFHFWTGLQLIGFAIGRNVLLMDSPPVVGNLFTVLVGPSGTGKSRAKRHLRDSVAEVMPYDETNPFSAGTRIIGQAGSGEYLLSRFSSPIEDPTNPKRILAYAPVRGLVDYEEFATLVATAGRSGATLKTGLMDLYDAQKHLAGGSQTHGKRTAQNPFGQAISTTQNASLTRLLSKADDTSGFINRWIFAGGKPKPVRSWGTAPVNLTEPNAKLQDLFAWGGTGREVTMTEAALHLWDEFFHSTLHPSKLIDEQSGSALLGRIDLTLKKLILLFTANLKLIEVPVDVVKSVINLFPYLVATYGTVATEITRTEEVDHGNAITRSIKALTVKLGRAPTNREIYLANQAEFKSYSDSTKVLKSMEELGLISSEPYKPKGPGRPSVRYYVND